MRKLAVVVLMLLVLPAYAREARRKAVPVAAAARTPAVFTRLAHDPDANARLYAQMRGATHRASAIADNRSSRVIVIPAAGNAPGANNTHFRSDITFVNLNDTDQRATVLWLPNGDPSGIVRFAAVIESGPPLTYVDFVGQTLHLTGVGTLMILPVDASGNLDTNAALDAFSRIWSPAPNNGAGTFSQPFPAVDVFHLAGEYDALMLGLRQDAGFRTNYGIVNLSDFNLPFEVTVFNNAGAVVSEFQVTVRPAEMILRPLPAGDFGNISIVVSIVTNVPSLDFQWTTFASSTDNFNGDGWVSIGAKPYDDDDLDSAGQ
jgi:hypothetical protein